LIWATPAVTLRRTLRFFVFATLNYSNTWCFVPRTQPPWPLNGDP
jgi:hypothetical protein